MKLAAEKAERAEALIRQRSKHGIRHHSEVHEIRLERNGRLSMIKK